MKKVIFSVLILTAAWTVSAQEVTIYRLSSTTQNPARTITVPAYVVTTFERSYPGVTVIEWEPVSTMWRASYNENNRISHVYYSPSGENYKVVLPVLQNNVPEEVVTKAISLYGPSVYGITHLKSSAGNHVYQVRLMDNMVTKTVWLDEMGSSVKEADIYKVKVEDDEVKVKEQ